MSDGHITLLYILIIDTNESFDHFIISSEMIYSSIKYYFAAHYL